MSLMTIVLIAFGLSMDAFAVSISNGVVLKKVEVKNALKIGIWFGVFQALMPLIGWVVGIRFENYITRIDHWIALLLLGFIGGKMIYETLKPEDEEEVEEKSGLENKTLFLLAVATSIDALAVGVSFAFLKVPLVSSVSIIGIITFVLCFFGVLIGKRFGQLFKRNAELLGGIILILIGLKIFAEHTNILSSFNFLG